MKILGIDDSASSIFIIPVGGQVTLQATGLEGSDYIELELVRTTQVGPGGDLCCPGPVSLAEIGWHVPLTTQNRCCEEVAVQLTAGRPYLVLDTPQMLQLVAVKHAEPAAQIELFLEHTNSRGYNSIGPAAPTAQP